MKYLTVKKAVPVEGFNLILTFSNGEVRMLDMKPYLNKGVFKELRKVELFNTVHVTFDTVEWDNEADLDPEFLYQESKKVKGRKSAARHSYLSAAEPRIKYSKR